MKKDVIALTDHRTGKSYEIPVVNGTIRAMDLRQIKVSGDDFGLMAYDPAFQNTAACTSSVTYIDGDRGILRYRGYPIDELAEKHSYLEIAALLLDGELPDGPAFESWRREIAEHFALPAAIKTVLGGFDHASHPMGMLISGIAALSTFYPDAKDVEDPACRRLQVERLLGKLPTLAAYIHRRRSGLPFVEPDPGSPYAANYLRMVFADGAGDYKPNPVLEKAMDVLLTLHADHEQNCSTSAMRSVGSALTDPFCSTAAAAAALYGPLHGGANEAVLRMLEEIGSKKNVDRFIKSVKAGERLLMGFGHRVYKNYDPRAKIIKRLADEVFEVQGVNPLLEIALELERIALQDDYFVERKLYPNVDFYSGLIYQSIGFPVEMFVVNFAIGRTAGWLAQWNEMLEEEGLKIARPRQIYLGKELRPVP